MGNEIAVFHKRKKKEAEKNARACLREEVYCRD